MSGCAKIERDNYIYMEGQGNKKGMGWIVGGLAIIVVVVVFVVFGVGQNKITGSHSKATTPQLVATAPSGKIIEGMPQDLIMVHDAVIEKSEAYTTMTPSGTTVNLYTLTYKTDATLKNLYITYEKYAIGHGYAPMTGSLKATTGTYSFRTTKSPNIIYRVTINDDGQNREVNIIINKQ